MTSHKLWARQVTNADVTICDHADYLPIFDDRSTPQSFSHMIFAAYATVSVSQIAFAFGVITSLTFIANLLREGLRSLSASPLSQTIHK